jgi:hypothetical protein
MRGTRGAVGMAVCGIGAGFCSLAQAQFLAEWNGGGATGIVGGAGSVISTGTPLVLTNQLTNFLPASTFGGGGSTSGGLGETSSAPYVAELTAGLAYLAQPQTPVLGVPSGVPVVTVRLREDALGQFNSPTTFAGSLTSTVTLGSGLATRFEFLSPTQPVEVRIAGTGVFAGVTSITSLSDGAVYGSGSVIPFTGSPFQTFRVLAPGTEIQATVSNTNPVLARTSELAISFIVPAPGAAGLVLAGALAMMRRRRR